MLPLPREGLRAGRRGRVSLDGGEEIWRAGPLVPEGGAAAVLRRFPCFLGAQKPSRFSPAETHLPWPALRSAISSASTAALTYTHLS